MGDALCGQWNIVGVDLMSGVTAATWGRKEPTDWDLVAGRFGNEVRTHCPRWLANPDPNPNPSPNPQP